MKKLTILVFILLLVLSMASLVYADNSQQVLDTLNNSSYMNSLNVLDSRNGDEVKFFVKDMNNDGNFEIYILNDTYHISSGSCLITFINGQPHATESGIYNYYGCNPSTGIYVESNGWTGSVWYYVNQINSDGTVNTIHKIDAEYGTNLGNCIKIDDGDYEYFSSDYQVQSRMDSILSSYNLQQASFYDYSKSNFVEAITAAGGNFSSSGNSSTSNSYSERSNNYSITNRVVAVFVGRSDVFVGDSTDNGAFYSFNDSIPYISNSSVMVPLRGLGEVLTNEFPNINSDEIVSWNSDTKTATVTIGNRSVRVTAGDEYMYVNGSAVYMGGAEAEIVDGRVYLPFRAIGSAFGINVNWDAENRMALYN